MYSFKNDYSEGCHPAILQALIESNGEQHSGYGFDMYSQQAADLIREKLKSPSAAVHFISGGTQANLTVIASILRPYESVIAVETGHILVHETGAIEATGHKIEAVQSTDGKLRPADVISVLDKFEEIHKPIPRLVYISHPTEIGTHYTRAELIALSQCCRENGLYLFIDGARLASGLCASDITFPDLAKYTDVFYIGGTKSGALLGEAIVINNPVLQQNFIYNLKQRGALLAKGRLLGIQFKVLFSNDLFFEIGNHMNQMAAKLATAFQEQEYSFLTNSQTNQIFPILPISVIEKLQKKYDFYIWQKINSQESAIRLVTSWATKEAMIDQFIEDLSVASEVEKKEVCEVQ
ncbi:aminotransferase class V-fold PLP-dependent enzyme [Cytophagaceae bacterium YF14B1]|uniref:Aminotransferase class V-fold PLP-dependent enzyme n=1 Tax=Xanthocytophaga flava TaxID=3048013 RepID=A0AAE3QP56_9BACT|nr:aminotransferase class V-fold PLP-dependent enzyme [Xanthocytophaga flavus]MDJ1482917.1 aminotransferase class V-fold PLP-dependent enzyme [Xanthocytophaga flavus]